MKRTTKRSTSNIQRSTRRNRRSVARRELAALQAAIKTGAETIKAARAALLHLHEKQASRAAEFVRQLERLDQLALLKRRRA